MRARWLLLLFVGVAAMAAEQPPQLEIRYLDEMEKSGFFDKLWGSKS